MYTDSGSPIKFQISYNNFLKDNKNNSKITKILRNSSNHKLQEDFVPITYLLLLEDNDVSKSQNIYDLLLL